MEVFKALELIEQLEMNLGSMYSKLQEKFGDNRELAGLFHQLHREEMNHAYLAKTQMRSVGTKSHGPDEVHLDVTDFSKVMHMMRVVLAVPPDKINEVLVQCYLIESSLVEQYVVAALKESNPKVKQLLEVLNQGFRDHLATLAVRVKDLGGDLTNRDAVRLYPRVSFSGTVMINETISSKSVDISESGMFLLTAQTFPENTNLTLTFPVGDGVVTAQALVRYFVPQAGIGLLFKKISEKHHALIRAYVVEALHKISTKAQRRMKAIGDKQSGTA